MPARRSLTAAALGCALTASLALPARADESATPAPGIPVVESVKTSAIARDVPPDATLTLHAVRRVGPVTVVYFSIGLPATPPSGTSLNDYVFGGALTTGLVLERVTSEAAILDRRDATVYTPLVKEGDGCIICTDATNALIYTESRADTAVTAFVGLPALPAGVSQVDVMVGNRHFLDVPVGDGPLEPAVAAADNKAPLLGQGWPAVDTTALPTATDPRTASIHPLVTTVSSGAVTRRTTTAENYDLSAKVLFDKDRAVVRPAGVTAIKELAARLQGTSGTLTVTGYTDNLGSHEHGLELSRRRAEAVAAILKPLLPPGVTLTTSGRAEADPVASNGTEEGREQNRRVTITPKANR